MKFFLIISLFYSHIVLAQSISGEISVKGEVPQGVLYIFAKKFGSKMPMPLAVKKIKNPQFPVKFELSQSDAMMKQIPFKGPFKITARISPSGNAMDKTGIESSTVKEVKLGDKDIKILLSN